MINGFGTDIIQIPRIETLLATKGDAFITRIFTEDEISKAEKRTHPKVKAAYYAKRFAAKEAIAKALGTGIGAECAFKDISIANNNNGAPQMTLTGKAHEGAVARAGKDYILHLSLSDDYPVASATVILERR